MVTIEKSHTAGPLPPGVIRKVLRSETHLIEEHFLRLDADARHRRFGHDVSDGFIHDYVARSADVGNITFAYFAEGEIHAIAELRRGRQYFGDSAEVAFSVERHLTNMGLGTRLMGRVIRTARNRGIRHLILVCLPENRKMQAIARHYGADLHVEDGAIAADIIPTRPDMASLVAEFLDDRMLLVQAALDLQTRLARLA